MTKTDRLNASSTPEIEDAGAAAASVWSKVQSLIGPSFAKRFGLTTVAPNDQPERLIAPLVWAMNTADTEIIDIAKQADTPSMREWLRSFGPFGPIERARKIAFTQVRNLVCRRPAMTDTVDPVHQDALSLKTSLRRKLWASDGTIALAIGLIIWIGVSSFDAMRTNSFRRVAEDPASNKTELIEAEQYFAAYDARGLWISILGLNANNAIECRDRCRAQLARIQWDEINAEVDPVKKGKLAEEYSGLEHAEAARELISVGKTEKNRIEYEAWFEPLNSKQKTLTMEERSELIDSLAALPKGVVETTVQTQHRRDLLAKLRKDQDTEQRRAVRQVFIEQVANQVDQQRPFEALGAIRNRPESIDWPEMTPTLTSLRDGWSGDINSRLSRFRQDEQYETAVQTIQKAIRDLKVISDTAALPAKPNLDELLEQIQLDWDKADYDNLREFPSLTTAKQYMEASHPKCMSQAVNRWITWNSQKGTQLELRPHLESITWDKDYGAYDPLIDLYINGKPVLIKTPAGDGDYAVTHIFPELEAKFPFVPTESVECRILLWDENNWPWDDDRVGEFKGKFRFSDLTSTQGATGSFSTDDKKAMHKFRIRLLDVPAAPELLEWQTCK